MHGKDGTVSDGVSRLNSSRLEGYNLALAHAFIDAISGLGEDAKNKELHESWKALASMVREQDVRNGEFSPKNPSRSDSMPQLMLISRDGMASTVSTCARSSLRLQAFLENEFQEHMEQVIAA